MGSDATEAAVNGREKKSRSLSPRETYEAEHALDNFTVIYHQNDVTGRTSIEFSGSASFTIEEQSTPDGFVYLSPIVRSPQDNLRDAMEWTGRNLTLRAVSAAWYEQNPQEVRQTGRIKIDALRALKDAEIQRLQELKDAEIAAVTAQLDAERLEKDAQLEALQRQVNELMSQQNAKPAKLKAV